MSTRTPSTCFCGAFAIKKTLFKRGRRQRQPRASGTLSTAIARSHSCDCCVRLLQEVLVAVRAAVDVATLPLKKDAGPHVLREAASQVATNVANFYSMSSASKLLTKVVEAIAKARFRPVATARLAQQRAARAAAQEARRPAASPPRPSLALLQDELALKVRRSQRRWVMMGLMMIARLHKLSKIEAGGRRELNGILKALRERELAVPVARVPLPPLPAEDESEDEDEGNTWTIVAARRRAVITAAVLTFCCCRLVRPSAQRSRPRPRQPR